LSAPTQEYECDLSNRLALHRSRRRDRLGVLVRSSAPTDHIERLFELWELCSGLADWVTMGHERTSDMKLGCALSGAVIAIVLAGVAFLYGFAA